MVYKLINAGVLAIICEYVDALLGMGYGTTLTPLLIIVGFEPLQVVPAVLFGQLVGGMVGGIVHHRVGNIKLDFRQDVELKRRLKWLGYIPRSVDAKVVYMLVVCGVMGAVVAVMVAVNIPVKVLRTYIGVMVLCIGGLILVRKGGERLSWRRLIMMGFVSGFNKGISGGGYGPLVTGGQIVSGRGVKQAVGSTTMAEALICVVGFIGYLVMKGDICWKLAYATGVGSLIAGPLAAITVSKINVRGLRVGIGVATIILGVTMLVVTFR